MQDFLQLGDKRIDYTIIKRKRKTVGLSVRKGEGLVISAPGWVNKNEIKAIVLKKAPWIIKKLFEVESLPGEKKLDNGGELLFLGYDYRLEVINNPGVKKIKIVKIDDKIEVSLPESLSNEKTMPMVREALVFWYKQQAKTILSQRLFKIAGELKLNISKIAIRQQKTRWGSCSSKGNINLNWKLIMMPVSVIDYVLAHELMHLKEMNHSKSFWQLVEAYLPDFRERKRLLKDYGKRTNLLGF